MEDSLGRRRYRDESLGGVVGAVADLLDLLGCQAGWWVDEEVLVVQTYMSSLLLLSLRLVAKPRRELKPGPQGQDKVLNLCCWWWATTNKNYQVSRGSFYIPYHLILISNKSRFTHRVSIGYP